MIELPLLHLLCLHWTINTWAKRLYYHALMSLVLFMK